MRKSAHHQFLPFVFLLIYSGLSIQVHFGLFTQPCHWLKRLHLVITWGHTCFLVVVQSTQTICFNGWSRYWKSWCFFIRSTRCDINSLGEHGKIVWRHIHSGSLIAHLGSFCDGHLSFRMSAIFKVQCKRRVDSVAASPREYLVRRPAKNVISPPEPPKKNNPPRNNNAK